MAHGNRDRRDLRGDLWHLEHRVERDAARGEALARAFEGLHGVPDLPIGRPVVRGSCARAGQGGARTWLRDDALRLPPPGWRGLLPA